MALKKRFSQGYEVEIKQDGRTGWVIYAENDKNLPFDWEFHGTGGATIFVPSSEEWNRYCGKQDARWAKGQRKKILERLGEGFLRTYYGGGDFVVEENWIAIHPSPSFISRLLNYFT